MDTIYYLIAGGGLLLFAVLLLWISGNKPGFIPDFPFDVMKASQGRPLDSYFKPQSVKRKKQAYNLNRLREKIESNTLLTKGEYSYLSKYERWEEMYAKELKQRSRLRKKIEDIERLSDQRRFDIALQYPKGMIERDLVEKYDDVDQEWTRFLKIYDRRGTYEHYKKQMKELETLIPEAKRLSKSGYVSKLRKSLLKSELERIKQVDIDELRFRVASATREENRTKKFVDEEAKRKEEQFLWLAKQDVQQRTKEQINKELIKIQKEQKKLYEKRMIFRPDDRTARKAHLENKLDGNAIRMRYLKDVINQYDELKGICQES